MIILHTNKSYLQSSAKWQNVKDIVIDQLVGMCALVCCVSNICN